MKNIKKKKVASDHHIYIVVYVLSTYTLHKYTKQLTNCKYFMF